MTRHSAIVDAALAAAAGLVATQAMGAVTSAMSSAQSASDRAREKAVSPGIAYELAAERGADLAGVNLSRNQVTAAGSAVHYGLGAGWALAYPLLRRTLGMHPVIAGLVTGLGLELIVDQGANSALGLSAPPGDYPASTHVRGVAGHLVYGLVLAAGVEAGWTLLDR